MGTLGDNLSEGWTALFDEPLRAAQLSLLLYARSVRPDLPWPTVPEVRQFAGLYGVRAADLGAFFGWIVRREGGREIWVDALGGSVHPGEALSLATNGQARAYGFLRMALS